MAKGSKGNKNISVMGGGSIKAPEKANSKNGKPNDATEYYVSGEGMWINQYLRGRGDFGELSDSEKQYIKDLDTATNGKITDETLYRSVDAKAIFGNIDGYDYDNLRQLVVYGDSAFDKGAYSQGLKKQATDTLNKTLNKTITEKGYMSTTTSENVAADWGDFTGAENPIIMKITPSKNTKGVNLSGYDKNVSSSEAQHERLLARNQQYDIKKIYGKNGYIYVDAKMR